MEPAELEQDSGAEVTFHGTIDEQWGYVSCSS